MYKKQRIFLKLILENQGTIQIRLGNFTSVRFNICLIYNKCRSFQIVTRTSKSNEILSGFATVILSLASESKDDSVKQLNEDLETQCLVSQWLDYSVLFVSPAVRDRHATNCLLKELNQYLSIRTYLVGNSMTVADLAVFYTIENIIMSLGPLDKENYLNISRWYNHLQQNKQVRQGGNSVNFSTIHLIGWVTGTHMQLRLTPPKIPHDTNKISSFRTKYFGNGNLFIGF